MKTLKPPLSKTDLNNIKDKLFIYPPDTIYGIGCNATSSRLVNKIRKIKQRDEKPFSVIAPSMAWIEEHCEINE